MGGFTSLKLRNTSQENIDQHNQHLDELGVAKAYRFHSMRDRREEWEYYRDHPEKRMELYPPHLFPQDIGTFEEFLKYWSTENLGDVFIPPIGTLKFDCYFGRTSKRAMHGIAQYLLIYGDHIRTTSGSYSTFVERCGYKAKTKQRELMLLDKR